AASGAVVVVEGWGLSTPKTKEARQALDALGVEPRERVLVVLPRDDEAAWKSFRNLGERVALTSVEELSAYDVLVADRVIFTADTLAALATRAERGGPPEPEALGDESFGAASPPVIDPTPATPGSEVPLANPPEVPEEAPAEAPPAEEAGEEE
ncbi:MAG: 50S ribosomal protein L4, partial [Actinomycetota bacterium]|nr:50S ribosomal protein L4 [Actinomycetota bacterium]